MCLIILLNVRSYPTSILFDHLKHSKLNPDLGGRFQRRKYYLSNLGSYSGHQFSRPSVGQTVIQS